MSRYLAKKLVVTGAAGAVPLNRAFDAFLYAPIGEEGNGMVLTVVSALARQNVDPWALALHLSRLPGEAAVREMTALIVKLSAVFVEPPAPEAMATRLVALLPPRNGRPPGGVAKAARLPGVEARRRWLPIFVGYLLIILASQWVLAGMHKQAPAPAPKTIAR